MVFDEVFDDFLFRIERFQIIQTHRFDGDLHDLFFAHAKATLLFGQIITASVHQHLLRNQAHNLASRDADTTSRCFGTDFLKTHMDR